MKNIEHKLSLKFLLN